MARSVRALAVVLALALLGCIPVFAPRVEPHAFPVGFPEELEEELSGPGWYHPARLGVEVQEMTPELRRYFRVDEEVGVLVVGVQESSPAAEAGILVGDVLLEVGDEPLHTARDLRRRVGAVPEGAELAIDLVRGGEKLELTVRPRGPGWAGRGGPHGAPSPMQDPPGMMRELIDRLDRIERRLDRLEHERAPATP